MTVKTTPVPANGKSRLQQIQEEVNAVSRSQATPVTPAAKRAPATTPTPTPAKKTAVKIPAKPAPAKKQPASPQVNGTASSVSTEPDTSRSAAKQDLGERLVKAIASVISSADGSELFLKGMTRDEAARVAAQWIHHFPTGKTDGKRNWPAEGIMPRPDRSDWR